MIIWRNGSFVEMEAARPGFDDRGFLLGDGVFETLLVQAKVPVFLDEHLARLASAATAIGISLPVDIDALTEICRAVAARLPDDAMRASMRITLSRGAGPRGLLPPEDAAPQLYVAAAAAPQPPPKPVRLIMAQTRRNEGSLVSRLKTLSYLDSVLARMEAKAAGADEAIMLNNAGAVASASAANVFVIAEGALFTPPIEDGVLNGIVRQKILDCAEGVGLSLQVSSIAPRQLQDGCVFLTNSLIGVQSAAILDGRPLSDRPEVDRLRQAYSALIDEYIAAHVQGDA
ncbi:MAG: aminotransferase class IV [Pseudomonadota bacterium]